MSQDLFRSQAVTDAYKKHRESGAMDTVCPLCEKKALRTFTFWKVVPNDFPYDLIAEVHHMLVPLRHSTEAELTTEEYNELVAIKSELSEYDFIAEAMPHWKSIPAHFHLHLLSIKREE